MKILLTGGGTGGHFYPIIAVAQELNKIIEESKLVDVELYYMSPTPYNAGELFNNNLIYKKNYAGKLRRYFSIMNFFDLFKTFFGVIKSLWEIFLIYPDVVFGKGGYASFPALFAARILRIPVVIHESDSVPGKVNKWAGKFADRVAISYPDAAKFFPKNTVALTGNPIRKDLTLALTSNAHEYLHLDPTIPTIFIIGGSLGSQKINEVLMEALPKLVEKYQIIHQTGENNIEEVKQIVEAVLIGSTHKDRYHPYAYMDSLTIRSAAGAANLVISRAGSTIFEIAVWGIPSIIIPISEEVSHDQTKNAFAYARTGGSIVIEEENLTGNILTAEIDRILDDKVLYQKMKEGTKEFVHLDSARKIAEELIKIGLRHEI
jgi:UDP-N-acetylglucosamine--N-acetylmuramyl-(pentapeptide) pyrophosphoryl-undecaprenol N-acetylglucosamine transferase